MFICNECLSKETPRSFIRSYGRCEICGKPKDCNDIPHDAKIKLNPPNKWQIELSLKRDYNRCPPVGWRILSFGIYKITNYPEEGARLTKENYKGFLIRLYVWFPVEII